MKGVAALLCGLLATTPGAASAAGPARQDADLVNHTGHTITALFLAPSRGGAWSADTLDGDAVDDGGRVRIAFDRSERRCDWDVRARFEDGGDVEWSDLDLCRASVVRLGFDDASGAAWADAE